MTTPNPPAFPVEAGINNRGLTMLDHFAGLAMQGMLADLPKTLYGLDWQEKLVESSYAIADAMLKERQKWIK